MMCSLARKAMHLSHSTKYFVRYLSTYTQFHKYRCQNPTDVMFAKDTESYICSLSVFFII